MEPKAVSRTSGTGEFDSGLKALTFWFNLSTIQWFDTSSDLHHAQTIGIRPLLPPFPSQIIDIKGGITNKFHAGVDLLCAQAHTPNIVSLSFAHSPVHLIYLCNVHISSLCS